MIALIAWRELRALVHTPMGWLLAGVSQFVLAWWFFVLVDRYRADLEPALVRMHSPLGVSDLIIAPWLGGLPVFAVLLVAAAVLGMRAFAEEQRTGSLTLLLAAPVSGGAVVLGKYLGGLTFLTGILLLWASMPLSLLAGTELDLGRLGAGLFGLWLTGASLLALALLASTLTSQPGAAALLAFGMGLLLLLVGQGDVEGFFGWLGLTGHYGALLTGTVSSADLAYFAIVTTAALLGTVWRVARLREGV